MNFLSDILLQPSITQTLFILMLTIAVGTLLGDHIRLKHFSLGITWILFVGIAVTAVGLTIDHSTLDFAKNLGLILFIYSVGLQMAPSFFSSFSSGGLKMNALAVAIVLLGCICAVTLCFITGEDMATMIGVLSGAVTCTPSMGTAEQAFLELNGTNNPGIAAGYAVAYPLGVIGTVLAIIALKKILKINLQNEEDKLKNDAARQSEPVCVDITIRNPQISTLEVRNLSKVCPVKMVISRIIHPDGSEIVADKNTSFGNGDIIRVLTERENLPALSLLGQIEEHQLRSREIGGHMVSTRIAVTKSEWNGKKISDINLREKYHATITRVTRAGINLLATPDLRLQLGDRLVVVGEKEDVKKVTDIFGDELRRLDIPNLMPIALGIVFGIMVGSIPIPIPGMEQSFKLGLAGGTLIVALLVGRFGPTYKMVTFTTPSANMMLRQIGLCIFLAAVGLSAGEQFIPSIVAGGYLWLLYAFLLAFVPLICVGLYGYKRQHLNFFTLAGMMTGAMTDAPALAFAESMSEENGQASVGYATVYPLTTFLRVMVAQLLIMFLC